MAANKDDWPTRSVASILLPIRTSLVGPNRATGCANQKQPNTNKSATIVQLKGPATATGQTCACLQPTDCSTANPNDCIQCAIETDQRQQNRPTSDKASDKWTTDHTLACPIPWPLCVPKRGPQPNQGQTAKQQNNALYVQFYFARHTSPDRQTQEPLEWNPIKRLFSPI